MRGDVKMSTRRQQGGIMHRAVVYDDDCTMNECIHACTRNNTQSGLRADWGQNRNFRRTNVYVNDIGMAAEMINISLSTTLQMYKISIEGRQMVAGGPCEGGLGQFRGSQGRLGSKSEF